MTLSETAWTAGEQQQDFDALFLEHWSGVYRLLYRMLGDDAEDAAQEVFLKLYTKPPRPGSNYRAWLYKVASREGLNRLRSRGRQDGLLGRLTSLWSTHSEPSPEDVAEGREESQGVRVVLARMRPLYAQLLLLRHEGMEYGELAEITGVGRGSIGTLLARAEQQFERLYTESGGRHEMSS